MASLKPVVYRPTHANSSVYNKLYHFYRLLHDTFGGVDPKADLAVLMKDLLTIKDSKSL